MSAVSWQLAQVNIGRIRAPINDPIMAEFAGALAEINALAEQSAGFVWRLKGDNGDATEIQAFSDPLILVNMSVWTDMQSLHNYVYRTMHGRFFARRQAWFEKYAGAHLALWWIVAGQYPTTAEAKTRLATIAARGSSVDAFTFREAFPPPETPSLS
jgi:uncharacterized protein DUF3291